MNIRPVHQNPTDLVLATAADLNDLTLTVLRCEELRVGAWRFAFHIIGESHVVTVKHHDQSVWCELLACIDIHKQACDHHHAFTDLSNHVYRLPGYQVEVKFSDNAGAAFGAEALEVHFPEIYGHTPVTRIEWTQDAGVVGWRTLHVYPQKQGVLYVHSISHFDPSNYNRDL